MNWIDIASIVFVCVTANHLGLVKTIEGIIGRELRIVNCPRCCTYWCVLAYLTVKGVVFDRFVLCLAVSFLSSYLALWFELLEGYIDTLYIKLYETIYPNTDTDTTSSDSDNGYPASTMP